MGRKHIGGETKAEQRTILLSSHILPEVERIRDRVAILRDDEIVAVEAVAGLVNRKVRHLTVSFEAPMDAAPFAALPRIAEVRRDSATIRLTLNDGQQLDPRYEEQSGPLTQAAGVRYCQGFALSPATPLGQTRLLIVRQRPENDRAIPIRVGDIVTIRLRQAGDEIEVYDTVVDGRPRHPEFLEADYPRIEAAYQGTAHS